jgi:hypothetical protein
MHKVATTHHLATLRNTYSRMSHDKQKTAETTIAKDDKTIRTIHKIRYYLAKYYPECELIKTYIALWNEYDAIGSDTGNVSHLDLLRESVPSMYATLPDDCCITYAHLIENAKITKISRTRMMKVYILYKQCLLYYNSTECLRDMHRIISFHTRAKQLHSSIILIDKYVDLGLAYYLNCLITATKVQYDWCVTTLHGDRPQSSGAMGERSHPRGNCGAAPPNSPYTPITTPMRGAMEERSHPRGYCGAAPPNSPYTPITTPMRGVMEERSHPRGYCGAAPPNSPYTPITTPMRGAMEECSHPHPLYKNITFAADCQELYRRVLIHHH